MSSRSLYRSVLSSNQSSSNVQNIVSGADAMGGGGAESPLLRRNIRRIAFDSSPLMNLSPVSSLAVDLNFTNLSSPSVGGAMGSTPCRRLSMCSSMGGNTPPAINSSSFSALSSKSFPPERRKANNRMKQHLSCSEYPWYSLSPCGPLLVMWSILIWPLIYCFSSKQRNIYARNLHPWSNVLCRL